MFKFHNHLVSPSFISRSPNFSDRPVGAEVSLVVLHGISLPPGQFGTGYVHDFFLNQLNHSLHPYFRQVEELKVSSHLLIERTGKMTQFVPFNLSAHHAGVSIWNGKEKCNDFSIGIELEGTDSIAYEDAQYSTLIKLLSALKSEYPSLVDIVGHCDVSPGRKTDPGPSFNWDRLHELKALGWKLRNVL